MAERYDVGDLARVYATFTDINGAAIDPSNVYCVYTDPSGNATSLHYGIDAALTKSAVGHYAVDIDVDEVGVWLYHWYSTGVGQASEYSYFTASLGVPGAVPPGTVPEIATATAAPESGVHKAHRTLLSLEEYAQVMGLDAMRIAGGSSASRPSSSCDDTWFEFDWQDDADKIGRTELLNEIEVAEEDIAKFLRWWPGPVWVLGDEVAFPRFSQRPEDSYWAKQLNAFTTWCKLRAMGGLQEYTIAANAVTRLSDIDADGDGFAETAVFTINAPTGTLPGEIRAYFKEYAAGDSANCRTDPASSGPDRLWEVWPLACTLNETSGVITVYVKVWWLFKPQLRYGLQPSIIDADDSASYVDTLTFTRQALTTSKAQLVWLNSSDSCVESSDALCASIRDAKAGTILIPQDEMILSACANPCADAPNLLRLWYTAGEPILTHFWAEMIAILATSRLPRPLCSCNPVSQRVQWWQTDLAYTGGEGGHMTSPATLSNPFGTRRGEDWVWKRIQKYRIPARPYLG